MTAANFAPSLARVLVYEGGNVDDPRDPGGRTRKGVTQRTYNFYRTARGLPVQDVYLMSDDDMAAIYRSQYWDAAKCDQLPAGVDFAVFDAAVNSGVAQAGRWLQKALGGDYTGKIDGQIGAGTVAAANAAHDPDILVGGICARRLATLQTLKTWPTYKGGWSARIANVVKIGQAWAAGSVGPLPVNVSLTGGAAKANIEDAKKPVVSINSATITAAVGTTGTTVSGVVSAFDPIKEAMGSYLPWIAGASAAVAAVGLTLTALAHQLEKLNLRAKDGEEEVPTIDLSADGLMPGVQVPS